RMGNDLAILAIDPGVDENVGAGLVIVPVVVRRVLVPPSDLAAAGVEGDGAVGEEVIAGTECRIIGRNRIARAPVCEIAGRCVSTRAEESAAASLPGIVRTFPGLAAGLARGRDRIRLPFDVTGRGIERGEPAAQATVSAGAPDQDRIPDRQRRRGE